MPKKAEELSALAVKHLKQPGLHFVGGVAGLALQIAAGGSKSWILRATVGGKVRDMGLGGYPDVSLVQARQDAQEARALIRQGIDPIDHRKVSKSKLAAARAADVTFETCAMDYLAMHEPKWSQKSYDQWKSSLEKHVFPIFGSLIVRHVDTEHVLKVLEPIWTTKTETATRVRGRIEKILTWAKGKKLRTGDNPAAWTGHLAGILPSPDDISEEEHFKALPYREMGGFMKRLRAAEGQGARCLEFTVLTAVRSGEGRGAKWSEIDFQERLWIIPKERMKDKKKEHRVPLSKAAIALLEAQPQLDGTDLIFPSARNKVLSDATLGAVLKRMKVDATVHGFRSAFKDWAADLTHYANEVSEMALAHAVSNQVEQAYRRSDMFEKRRHIMNDWAEFCGKDWVAPKRAEVVALRA